MKAATIFALAAIATLECQASSFREPRMLLAADCNKDCTPESGLSWTLCKLGQAGSCTWQGVSSAGSYVYHGAARLVGAHSEPEQSAATVETPSNTTAAPKGADVAAAPPSSEDKEHDEAAHDDGHHQDEKEPAHGDDKEPVHEHEMEPAQDEHHEGGDKPAEDDNDGQ
ncbi:hypothetical protein H310_06916 [Aphanomyces invadans]|uniref:Uncharacterized protein n=1 Tax=Aphanomyces invadans TaxID=157072 RepID=A0A024U4N6_9STRA|nr:hypothetical protein H310_06916 [Aphanomyces invadans]ETW01361.1 hypothetical protein H310_06916 [Aphanomyces invadans]RHY31479.1 hypothetical protein DYB32_003459 [Aphanomyces invadans]|eukprot:XP_008870359.1 hypothetical protein H310_06916 [Aphanomyces invadans]